MKSENTNVESFNILDVVRYYSGKLSPQRAVALSAARSSDPNVTALFIGLQDGIRLAAEARGSSGSTLPEHVQVEDERAELPGIQPPDVWFARLVTLIITHLVADRSTELAVAFDELVGLPHGVTSRTMDFTEALSCAPPETQRFSTGPAADEFCEQHGDAIYINCEVSQIPHGLVWLGLAESNGKVTMHLPALERVADRWVWRAAITDLLEGRNPVSPVRTYLLPATPENRAAFECAEVRRFVESLRRDSEQRSLAERVLAIEDAVNESNLLMSSSPARFNQVASETAALWEAYTYIAAGAQDDTGQLDGWLRAHDARHFGAPQGRIAPLTPDFRKFQVRHACDILGGLAYEMFVREVLPHPAVRDTGVLLRDVVNRLHRAQVVDFFGNEISKRDLLEQLESVLAMDTAALMYVIISASEREVRWTDIITQAFFAAYWACRSADDEDRRTIWRWLPDPFGESNAVYAEFWRFVAEMPIEAVDSGRFELLLAPLYDGTWKDGAGLPIRSTELIYRSWERMKNTAAGQIFQSEFRHLLTGRGKRAQVAVAKRMLEAEGEEKTRRESQFLSLCRGERGKKDTGRFPMGAPVGDDMEQNNPLHPVSLTHFRLHRYCVTNAEYELFDRRHAVRRELSDDVQDMSDHPVVNVNWYDAWCFSAWLHEIEVEGQSYRVTLPSEAQWEFACRAGSAGSYCFGDDVSQLGYYAWFGSDSGHGTHPVGQKRPNAWGLYDMHGNVWEWCDSWFDESAIRRVLRGGSCDLGGWHCRSGYREKSTPGKRHGYYGFRLAAVPVGARDKSD